MRKVWKELVEHPDMVVVATCLLVIVLSLHGVLS